MMRPDSDLLIRAAVCYQRVEMLSEAARCFREAGSHRQAAELNELMGRHRDAALNYADAGHPDIAAWLLVHHADDPAAARDQLARPAPVGGTAPVVPELRRQLVEARCDVAEGRKPRAALEALNQACTSLASPMVLADQYVETWAVAVAEAIGRDDQVALVFAASVRGWRPGAEQRWRTWMSEVLHSELVLPAPAPVVAACAR